MHGSLLIRGGKPLDSGVVSNNTLFSTVSQEQHPSLYLSGMSQQKREEPSRKGFLSAFHKCSSRQHV